ncbi:ABC transporter ATP-binding protein [Spirochaetia bacterium]|nr:ABC transporter ATP-binding protein [Spirochaetia bacterium]
MERLFLIRNLHKYYHMGIDRKTREERVLKALSCLNFDIFRGETLGVVGESGSGKTTLGRCILNLIKPTQGSVFYRRKDSKEEAFIDMKDISRDEKALRRDMQMVFQNPLSSFNPKMSIGRTLRKVAAFYGMDKAETEKRIEELLGYVNLDRTMLSRRSTELSGGQLQRLAIVRALIPSPSFIMADEPVSALDVSVQAQILNLLDGMKEKFGLTMMFISHELTVVEHICDRILVMYLGSIVEYSDTKDLFDNTMHPYTKALISSKPRMFPDEEIERVVLDGEIPNALDVPKGCRFFSRCPLAEKGKCDAEQPPLYRVAEFHWVSCYRARKAAEEYSVITKSNLDYIITE